MKNNMESKETNLVSSQRPNHSFSIFPDFHVSTFLWFRFNRLLLLSRNCHLLMILVSLRRLSTGDNSSLLAMRTPTPKRWWKRHPSSASYSDSTLHPPSVEGRLLGAFFPSASGGRRYPTTKTHLHIERAPGPLKSSLKDFYFKVT